MRIARRPWGARVDLGACGIFVALAASACTPEKSSPTKRGSATAPPIALASARPSAAPATSATVSVMASGLASAAAAPSASSSTAPPVASATTKSRDACKLVRGPIALPYVGPVALVAGPDGTPRALFNDAGTPRLIVPAERDGGSPDKASSPACAIAGDVTYCVDTTGTIKRTKVTGEELLAIKGARAGSPISAAAFPNGHTVVAYLSDKKTTEGRVLVALASLDDGPAVQLSEDGSGANSVALAARGDRVFATYVDARTALTPVHARTLEVDGTRLKASKDAVVFVGEGSTHVVPAALGIASTGEAFALLATDKDTTSFGMAAIKLTPDPVDDAPVAWSLYPGGMTTAPVAATAGANVIHVARVRVTKAEESSLRILELGRLDPKGAFTTTCTITDGPSITEVAMTLGAEESVWIAYTKSGATYLEQRREPASR